MKIKTSDLIGPALDWATGKCLGYEAHLYVETISSKLCFQSRHWTPSTAGSEVIDIMELEKITTTYDVPNWGTKWEAYIDSEITKGLPSFYAYGPTLRIAVCRCFVASRLGDEVDVPDELLQAAPKPEGSAFDTLPDYYETGDY